MKLLDKIKDLFMDDVTDDDELEFPDDEEEREEEQEKREVKNELPKVMRDTIESEEKIELREKRNEKIPEKEEKVELTRKKFSFPIDIESDLPSRNEKNKMHAEIEKKEEEPKEPRRLIKKHNIDVGEIHSNNINVLNLEKETPKKVSELYARKVEDKNIKPKFKASPVISPVYGILDKNYTKEEVKERTDDNIAMKRPSKKVDFETVRKKAFGNLADDIKDNMLCENCELYKEVKKISALSEDDLLYDMTVDDNAEKEVTIEKAYDDYEEFGVAYEPRSERRKTIVEEEEKEEPEKEIKFEDIIKDNNQVVPEKETFSSIRSKVDDDEYEEMEEERVAIEKEEPVEEIKEEVKEEVPSRSDKKKDAKVDEDFFELIDSMYKERSDD